MRKYIEWYENKKGDTISVYIDTEKQNKIFAVGDIIGCSFREIWTDEKKEYYIKQGFKKM